ncbi:DNA-binding protein [Martelella limonii]|uniref:DNA-binding protein n=1 Tax=Martelella limonii TaxID=1647649 RepID=UPI0015802674|nr:DNA-binding protein [Martelella limonii]
MTIEEALSKPTISVPDAGALFFGLARNAAYEAAKRGDIETIRVGGRIVVPVAPLAARLGLTTKFGAGATA